MSEETKKKINLSGLKLGSQEDTKIDNKVEALDLEDKRDTPKSNKISLAGMKQERSNKVDSSKKVNVTKEVKIKEADIPKKVDIVEKIDLSKKIDDTVKTRENIEIDNEASENTKETDNINKPEEGNNKVEKDNSETISKEEESNDSKVERKRLSLSGEKVEFLLKSNESGENKNNKKEENKKEENKKEENKKEENKKEEIIEINGKTLYTKAEERKSLFSNYTSDFEAEESSILKKIKELSHKPQTRVIFVMFLIVSTVGSIGALFIVVPEKHSFSHYKSVLSSFFIKEIETHNSDSNNNTVSKKDNNELIVTGKPKGNWKKDSIIRNGYKIGIENSINNSGVEIYRFNNSEFNTLDELYKEIDIEIKKIQTNKVKDFFLKPGTKEKDSEQNSPKETIIQEKASTQEEKLPVEVPLKKSALQLLQERR